MSSPSVCYQALQVVQDFIHCLSSMSDQARTLFLYAVMAT